MCHDARRGVIAQSGDRRFTHHHTGQVLPERDAVAHGLNTFPFPHQIISGGGERIHQENAQSQRREWQDELAGLAAVSRG